MTLPLTTSAAEGAAAKREWEYLLVSRDPLYRALVDANAVVIQYIAEKGLILYGGIAIDYALKLAGGEGIYSADMSATPDLDFYSENSVTDSYQLADLLYTRGYDGARAIAALHVETMKVDCGDKHWVADISYRPAAIMRIIPTLAWNGMRLVHPHYQRMDMHSVLATPYDNPPTEVIFARWAKDLKRFRLLEESYPFTAPAMTQPIEYTPNPVPPRARGLVWCGFAAWAVMRDCAAAAGVKVSDLMPGTMPDPKLFTAPRECGGFEFISFQSRQDLAIMGLEPTAAYSAISNIRAARTVAPGATAINVAGHLICISTVRNAATMREYRLVNAQYLLFYFLSESYAALIPSPGGRTGDAARISDIFRTAYASLFTLVERAEAVPELFPLLGLSVETYGADNTNMAKHILDARVFSRISGEAGPTTQSNYYPSRCGTGRFPPFDPERIHYFRDDGRAVPLESSVPTDGTGS